MFLENWWAGAELNRRPPRCQRGVIAPRPPALVIRSYCMRLVSFLYLSLVFQISSDLFSNVGQIVV